MSRCLQRIFFKTRLKNGTELVEGEKYESSKRDSTCNLYVKDLSRTDEDVYTCQLQCGANSFQTSCLLMVQDETR